MNTIIINEKDGEQQWKDPLVKVNTEIQNTAVMWEVSSNVNCIVDTESQMYRK